MPWDSTADDWERLGRLDPYWAVVSEEPSRREHMTDAQLARFLETGEAYVEHSGNAATRTPPPAGVRS